MKANLLLLLCVKLGYVIYDTKGSYQLDGYSNLVVSSRSTRWGGIGCFVKSFQEQNFDVPLENLVSSFPYQDCYFHTVVLISKRVFCSKNIFPKNDDKLCKLLFVMNHEFSKIKTTNCNNYLVQLVQSATKVFDKYCPVQHRVKSKNSWINQEIKKLANRKTKLPENWNWSIVKHYV